MGRLAENVFVDGGFSVAKSLTTPQSKLRFASSPHKGRHGLAKIFSLVHRQKRHDLVKAFNLNQQPKKQREKEEEK